MNTKVIHSGGQGHRVAEEHWEDQTGQLEKIFQHPVRAKSKDLIERLISHRVDKALDGVTRTSGISGSSIVREAP